MPLDSIIRPGKPFCNPLINLYGVLFLLLDEDISPSSEVIAYPYIDWKRDVCVLEHRRDTFLSTTWTCFCTEGKDYILMLDVWKPDLHAAEEVWRRYCKVALLPADEDDFGPWTFNDISEFFLNKRTIQ